MRGELPLHRVPDRFDELALLGSRFCARPCLGDVRPVLRSERQLAPLPRSATHLDRRLEQRELVGPRREAALTLELVELPQQRDERIIRALHGDVLELPRVQMLRHRAATPDLEARSAQEELVNPGYRLFACGTCSAKLVDPGGRLERARAGGVVGAEEQR